MSGDMPDLPEMPGNDDAKGLRAFAESVAKQNAVLREAGAGVASELSKLQRDVAFDKAGVPTDGWGSFFREKFDGDADPEVIKAAIDQYGFAQQTAAPTEVAPQAQVQDPPVDPLAAERQQMNGNAEVTSQFAQPPTGQMSALMEAMSKAESSAELNKILADANMLTGND